jgi:hypothetical protein
MGDIDRSEVFDPSSCVRSIGFDESDPGSVRSIG